MRAIVITRPTPQDQPLAPNLAFVNDWPEPPAPGPGQALVRTLASALNHLDLWVCRGVPGLKLTYPRVSGSDACGQVEAVGPGVDAGWIGRRVILNAAVDVAAAMPPRPGDPPASSLAAQYELIGEHHHGTMAERFVAPVSNLAVVPDDREATESAAFGLTFLTAYSMMIAKAGLRPGQSVLITGIGGGVALAAMAIARFLACPVAVTSRHAWKLERARALGADLAIRDNGQDWSKEVRAWHAARGGAGVDLAVDSAGKATHIKCIKSLARGGAYVTPGCTSGPDAVTDLARIFWNQLRILGSTMGSNTDFQELAALYRAGTLAPIVDQVFEASEGPAAYERLNAGEQFGKLVIRW